ncbi:hypothetical protein HN587_00625 [Candidatus Woesearchaeota archaeon]|nr:hypothetical protein [Candidatus Woesearchaeota archaeon]
MPGFDQSLDKEIFAEALEVGNSKLTVGVFAYNENEPKLQITRQNKTKAGEFTFARLGRLTKEEIKTILPLIQKAIESM